MTTKLDYGIIDCDTHCYETRDAFTRYLPKEFQDRAITTVRGADGVEVILAGRRVATFNSEGGLGLDVAYRPGSLKEMLRQMGSGDPDESYEPQPMQPEYIERSARLAVMEKQGVERMVIYPSGMALAAEHYVDDTAALYANLRSFNRWFDEEWGFNRDDRIYATGLLSLRDLDSAVAETEALIAQGARFVLLPTGPAYGRSPGDPYFDPIYARLQEAGCVLVFHIMPFWYFDAISPAWGHNADPASWHMSAWQWMNIYGQRPIEDTLSALIFDNLFGRFPGLKVLVAEHGAEWVPFFTKHMDKSRGMGRNGPWIGGKLTERPSAIFREHVRVVPYPEDDIPAIVAGLGYDDCLVMGSDYPHAEGLAEPADFVKLLDPLDDAAKKRIMRDNADQLLSRS
ncbi:amidohydrolase [Mycolicibacterium moriokaense]|uniref:Amidohydrolase n=1 Tax=Mycolicibacterium moriokaense TaxID=39691 RepID=A0AAD1HE45_9MYCO|nr:amidohydrolase family protein [Mycolicibacterium moriokaense]MCV7039225.1 amidohydrolase family protein [Mycolicibacterium moriokaense]ORB26922.1 amidohydrolase [Mycolicibacterium moriokaense]BBX03745.1 amidohydrolase [Mycolicibacterium moriokaense]